MKPSDIVINPYAPLVATFGKAELEQGIAIFVRVCQLEGDKFQPLTAEIMRRHADSDREVLAAWFKNPFFRPDIGDLIEKGWARRIVNPEGEQTGIELTGEALKRLEGSQHNKAKSTT